MDEHYKNLFFRYLDDEIEKYKIGKITKDDIKTKISIYHEWFIEDYYKYTKNKELLKELKVI